MAFYRNMVIILTHGLRNDAIGDAQHWPLRTTYMHKLMQRGTRLIGTSACPADSGAMISLLTGRHARQHGHLDQMANPGRHIVHDGFPAVLHKAGYYLAGVGCVAPIMASMDESLLVQQVEHVRPTGCQYMAAMRNAGQLDVLVQQREQRQRYGPFDPQRLVIDPDQDIDGYIGRRAQEQLLRMPTDRPWALIVMFSGPGNELPPPPLYQALVDPRILEDGFKPVDLRNVDRYAELDYPRVLLQRLKPRQLGWIRSDYLGRVALIDHGVGLLMGALRRRGDRDHTWFMLTSDRGALLGEHGLIGHRSFLSAALEVPVLIVPPTPTPQRDWQSVLVNTIDVTATIAALGACDPPTGCRGQSLLPLLGDDFEQVTTDGVCLSEFSRRLMLETSQHRVIFDTESHEVLGLYDLMRDSAECENLVDTVAGENVLDGLRLKLANELMPLHAA